jgi:hypothetical protein
MPPMPAHGRVEPVVRSPTANESSRPVAGVCDRQLSGGQISLFRCAALATTAVTHRLSLATRQQENGRQPAGRSRQLYRALS